MATGLQRHRTALRTAQHFCAGVTGASLLVGCGGAAGIRDGVSSAAESSSSAVSTARLALDLDARGKLTTAATSTTLNDALKELEMARSAVLRLSPTNQNDRDLRQETVTILDGSITGLTTAMNSVTSDDGRPSLQDGDRMLKSSADGLSALKTRLGGK